MASFTDATRSSPSLQLDSSVKRGRTRRQRSVDNEFTPAPVSQRSRRNQTQETKEDFTPDIVLENAQNQALIIPSNTNAFLPYQLKVIEVIKTIKDMKPNDVEGAEANQLRHLIQIVYEVFFGIDCRTGKPTAFYQKHGAAPIVGMNPIELTQQARLAKRTQLTVNQRAEDSLGVLRLLLQPLFNRSNDPSIPKNVFTAKWETLGANTDIAAPLNDITRLMAAVREIHLAGAHLIKSDPLFLVNRHERVQQGHLRVRNLFERVGYYIALNGYKSLLNMVANVPLGGENLAARMDAAMPAAYRSSDLGIKRLEAACGTFDTLYKSLDPKFGICWTPFYPPGTAPPTVPGEEKEIKPGYTLFKNALLLAESGGDQEVALQMLSDARGNILDRDPWTYPAFFILNANGDRDGPLIAYYYALSGGRLLYEKEGRDYLQQILHDNPTRFIQEMGGLVDTMEKMHRQFETSGGKLGEGFFGKEDWWQVKVRELNSQDSQTRQAAAVSVSSVFPTDPVGTIDRESHIANACRRKGTQYNTTYCEQMRKLGRNYAYPQRSTQQGEEYLMGPDVLKESEVRDIGKLQRRVANQQSKEKGEVYAQEIQDIAGEQITTDFLNTLRTMAGKQHARVDKYWLNGERPDTNNRGKTILVPGIITILNMMVHLEAPIQSIGRDKTRRHIQYAVIPRHIAGADIEKSALEPTAPIRLWQLLVRNSNRFKNISTIKRLLFRLGQFGTGIVYAATQGHRLGGFNIRGASMSAVEVRNIALQILQNPLWRGHTPLASRAKATYTLSSAEIANSLILAKAKVYFKKLNPNATDAELKAELNRLKAPISTPKTGGKRTRKHKKRRKKTRHRRKRGKKTRHKKKKRTRKK